MTLLREHIGSALRAEREGIFLSLRDVSAQAGVSLGYLSEVGRGLKEPSSEILECILDSLGTSIRDLLVEVLEVC